MKENLQNYKNTYVGVLLTLLGTITLLAGLYAPMLSKYLLTEELHSFDTENYILIVFGLLCLFGGLKNLTKSISDFYTKKLQK